MIPKNAQAFELGMHSTFERQGVTDPAELSGLFKVAQEILAEREADARREDSWRLGVAKTAQDNGITEQDELDAFWKVATAHRQALEVDRMKRFDAYQLGIQKAAIDAGVPPEEIASFMEAAREHSRAKIAALSAMGAPPSTDVGAAAGAAGGAGIGVALAKLLQSKGKNISTLGAVLPGAALGSLAGGAAGYAAGSHPKKGGGLVAGAQAAGSAGINALRAKLKRLGVG